MTASQTPLVVFGLDVGDSDYLNQWAREGYLPVLASLMERGAWGRTSGPETICEHGIWPTLFSGLSVAKHGYYYFRQLAPHSYDLVPRNGLNFEISPFWNDLKNTERKCLIMDTPDLQPTPGLKGIQINDWTTHYPVLPPTVVPAEAESIVRSLFGGPESIHEQLVSTPENDERILAALLSRIERKGNLMVELAKREAYDFLLCVFSDCHTGGHQFWKYRPGAAITLEVSDTLRHAQRSIHQAIDRQMGRILAVMPPDTQVGVLSSTGIEDRFPTSDLLEAVCRKLGYQAKPPLKRDVFSPLDIARRLLPESVRTVLSAPLPRSTQERLLQDKYRRQTDWSHSTIFTIPAYYTGYLQVNLKGREPEGIVPVSEYDALLSRFEADLRQLYDPLRKRPAIAAVHRTTELFGLSSPPERIPDLIIEWEQHTEWVQEVTHPVAGTIRQPRPAFFRDSNHSANAFFLVAGSSVAERGDMGDISLLDVAPTLRKLTGLPPNPAMTGRVLPVIADSSNRPTLLSSTAGVA